MMALTSIKNCNYKRSDLILSEIRWRDLCGSDCMIVGFITTYATNAYHH